MSLVVDASVAAKWSLPEEHSGAARALLFEQHELIAPDFISIELAQVMLKTVRRDEIARADALSALTRVHELLRVRASSGLVFPAFELATSLGTSVYDALYSISGQVIVPSNGVTDRYEGSRPTVQIDWQLTRHLCASTEVT